MVNRFLWLGVAAVACVTAAIVLSGCSAPEGSRPLPPESSSFEFDDSPQIDSEQPAGYTVKGNISVTTGKKLYHVPGMRDYEITVIDVTRGERWFRTDEEAVAAGWTRAVRE